MRRVVVVILVFIFTLNAHPAMSKKIEPGTKCDREGKSVVQGKSKFTCIKLGRKLYWDNGVLNKKTSQANKLVPATCSVKNSDWLLTRDGRIGASGELFVSGQLSNLSNTSTASDVVVTINWIDAIGAYFRERIEIPRLLPGQEVEFGTTKSINPKCLNCPPPPVDIVVTATCRDSGAKDKLPFLTGRTVLTKRELVDDFYPQLKTFDFSAKLLLTNTLDRRLTCKPECNAIITGSLRDQFDSTLGGFTDDLVIGRSFDPVDVGEVARLEVDLFELIPDLDGLVSRLDNIRYTIILKKPVNS